MGHKFGVTHLEANSFRFSSRDISLSDSSCSSEVESADDSLLLAFLLCLLFLRRLVSDLEALGFPYMLEASLEDLVAGSEFFSEGMGDVHKEMGMLSWNVRTNFAKHLIQIRVSLN